MNRRVARLWLKPPRRIAEKGCVIGQQGQKAMTSRRTDARRTSGRHTAAVVVFAALAGLFAAVAETRGDGDRRTGGEPQLRLTGNR